MKFLCDRCKTRYSIGDERVRGKILKIRCKNCANVITVREGMTDADAAEPESAAAAQPRRNAKPTTMAPAIQEAAQPAAPPPPPKAPAPAALEEEWYVSIDGEQSGPFSLQEAQKWISAKPLTADLHCWSEGFDDWLPVDKVSHFRGLRKKATAPNPIVPQQAPPPRAPSIAAAPPPPLEEEPKPLFAATMAAIERSVAPAVPKATPIGGSPSFNLPTPLPGPLPTAPPAIPKISNGSQPHSALRAQTPAKPLPAFDVAADVPTQMDVAPFEEAPKPPIQRSVGLPAPFKPDVPKADPFAAKLEAPKPDPFSTKSLPLPNPREIDGRDFGSAGSAAEGQRGSIDGRGFGSAGSAAEGQRGSIEMPSEEEMEIGEVSRVVNLADLAKSAAQRKAAQNQTAQVRRLGNTGTVPRLDPIDAMVASPNAGFEPMSPMAAQPEPAPPSHKKMYILLGAVIVLLLVVVGAVVFVVSQRGDDDIAGLAQNRDLDLSRPDDPAHPRVKPPVDDGSGSAKTVQPHRPYNLPNLNHPGSAQVQEPDLPTGNALKADEVEAMARTQSDATNRCYMRAQRGADAIIVGDVKKINVTLSIDPSGAVTDVGLSDHASDSLGKCLQSRIKGWKFRQSDKGLTTRLTLVFQAT